MLIYLTMLVLIGMIFIIQKSLVPQTTLYNTDKKKTLTPTTVCVFLILCFVAAFRYGVGTDFYSYYKNNNWVNKFAENDYSDPGFTIFSLVCEALFGDANGAITIGAAIFTIALFIFTLAKHGENFPMSIFLFVFAGCFLGAFNGVRQYLATAILFAGYPFIINKKPIKWAVVVLIAASVHITAILMFFVYFICNLKCNWKLVLGYFLIAVILLFAYEPLFNLIGNLKQDKIDTSDVYMRSSVNILRIAVQCVPIVLLFFVDKEKINNDPESRFLFNICLLNGALAIAAMNSPYLSRFWIYTSCFQILMYPKIFNKMRNDNKSLFTILLMVCYALFWVYEVMNASSLSTFKWIFDYL